MTIYTATIILTELMMLAMTLHVVAYPGFEWKQKRWYLFTFISIMLCAAAEWAAEVYDALVSERCYKKPMTHEEACRIIEEDAGKHFDPKLAKVFLDHSEAFRNV